MYSGVVVVVVVSLILLTEQWEAEGAEGGGGEGGEGGDSDSRNQIKMCRRMVGRELRWKWEGSFEEGVYLIEGSS